MDSKQLASDAQRKAEWLSSAPRQVGDRYRPVSEVSVDEDGIASFTFHERDGRRFTVTVRCEEV